MRRMVLIGSAGLLAMSCSDKQSGPSTQSTARSFQLDTAHTGWLQSGTLSPPLTQLWTYNVSGNAVYPRYPIVADGAVYGIVTTDSGSNQGALHGIDAATGKDRWYPIPLTSQPAGIGYDNGVLYSSSLNGHVLATDASTGRQQWSVTLQNPSSAMARLRMIGPPVPWNSTLYVNSPGGFGYLFGLDPATGATVWSTSDPDGEGYGALAIDSTGLYSLGRGSVAYALGFNGRTVWKTYDEENGDSGVSAIYGGQVFGLGPYSSEIIEAKRGAEAGTYQSDRVPAFFQNFVLFVDSQAGTLSAMDVTTRLPAWTFQGDGALNIPPLVINQTAYVVSSKGALFAVDAMTGNQLWQGTVPAPLTASDVANRSDQLLSMGSDGQVLVVPTRNGYVAFGSAPAAADGGSAMMEQADGGVDGGSGQK